jgi:hypothetical protein
MASNGPIAVQLRRACHDALPWLISVSLNSICRSLQSHWGQFVGGLIETTLIFAGGLYLLLLWPRIIRRRVEAGKLSPAEAAEKLRKPNPKLGYLLLAV